MSDYSIAMQESYKIIEKMGNKYFMLIPEDVRNKIENSRNKEYKFEYDENKTLAEQHIQPKTLDILSYLNFTYWCTQEEREQLLKEYNEKILKEENEKRSQYNPDDLFKEKKENNIEKSLINIEPKEKFIRKVIKKIRGFFVKQ